MLESLAETFETVSNGAKGPHRGSKLVPTDTGMPGEGSPHHRVQTEMAVDDVATHTTGRLWRLISGPIGFAHRTIWSYKLYA